MVVLQVELEVLYVTESVTGVVLFGAVFNEVKQYSEYLLRVVLLICVLSGVVMSLYRLDQYEGIVFVVLFDCHAHVLHLVRCIEVLIVKYSIYYVYASFVLFKQPERVYSAELVPAATTYLLCFLSLNEQLTIAD